MFIEDHFIHTPAFHNIVQLILLAFKTESAPLPLVLLLNLLYKNFCSELLWDFVLASMFLSDVTTIETRFNTLMKVLFKLLDLTQRGFFSAKVANLKKVSIDYLKTAHLDINLLVVDTIKCLSFEYEHGHTAVILRVANNLAYLQCFLFYMKQYENK